MVDARSERGEKHVGKHLVSQCQDMAPRHPMEHKDGHECLIQISEPMQASVGRLAHLRFDSMKAPSTR